MRLRHLLSWLVAATAYAGGIGVSPPRFDITLEGPTAADAFKVVNLGESPLHLKVSVAHFGLDEENRLVSLPPTPQSADQWLVVTPLEFVIEPGKTQTVRFAVRPRVKPEPGEHRAMIFLEEQPPQDRPFATLNLARVGVGVYVNVPPVERQARVHCVDFRWLAGKLWAALDISSLGNAHVRPQAFFVVWPEKAFPGTVGSHPVQKEPGGPVAVPEGASLAGAVPDIPVLPQTRRTLRFILGSVPPGEYVVELFGRVENEVLSWAVPLTVPEVSR
ncbi:MAG: fimbrial biogenesis chaperone [Thermoanaerobaculum sp.]